MADLWLINRFFLLQQKKPPALSFLEEVQTASPCLNDRYPILVLL
jgi:hypothetical protein